LSSPRTPFGVRGDDRKGSVNRLQICLLRQQQAFGLFLVMVISLAAMVLACVLVTTVFEDASQVAQGLILAATSVFV